ncbi:hypothetical protein D3C80_1924660 [compost metagenome]
MYTWTDQCSANVVPRAQRGGSIGPVIRIYIHRIRNAAGFSKLNQLAGHIIIIRSAGILGTDGDVGLLTA